MDLSRVANFMTQEERKKKRTGSESQWVNNLDENYLWTWAVGGETKISDLGHARCPLLSGFGDEVLQVWPILLKEKNKNNKYNYNLFCFLVV